LRTYAGEAPAKLTSAIRSFKKQTSEAAPTEATRKSSEKTLGVVNAIMPETVGGSADLTGSNNTKTADMGVFHPTDRKGRYIYYGVREHGMAAMMNGIALHGGAKAYGGPADTVETAEAWELALTSKSTPHVMALTRQNLPTVRTQHKTKNLSAQGGYVLADADTKRRAILIATGSEVSVAMDAKAILEAEGIGTRVVSMPCMELFAQQDEAYRKRVLPAGPEFGINAENVAQQVRDLL